MRAATTIPERKQEQLEICTDPSRFRVETSAGGAGFARLRLAHRALPELAADEVDPSVEFLGYRCALPLFISCMTGGSEGGFRVNRELARAAQAARVAVGSGSMRPLFRHPELAPQFGLKSWAPDVPVLANIGAVQVRESGIDGIVELLRSLEADALVVHLNPGQELFQKGGDRDFRGLRASLARLFEACPKPVIVKETGFGIGPAQARRLLADGAAFVDLAGSGGTNWIAAESYRLEDGPDRDAAAEFDEWGYPTALLLAALNDRSGRILASGGIRTGLDVVKALALGARMAGMALPFARLAHEGGALMGGAKAILDFIGTLEQVVRSAMLLSGSRRPEDLGRGILWAAPSFFAEAEALARADEAAG